MSCVSIPTMRARASPRHIGLFCVFLAAVAWSTSGLFTRTVAADAQTILFWRGLFGALGLFALMAAFPHFGGLGSFVRLKLPGFTYAAVTAVSMLLFVSALLMTTVAHVAVITAIVPFMAAYLAWWVLHERPGFAGITASLAALSGVAIMVGVGREGNIAGDGFAVLMALCMAVMILLSRSFPDIPALPATCVASALSALAVLPFVDFNVASDDLWLLFAFGLVNQVMGFGLFALGAKHLPPLETALITALDAPLAPLWVWLVFGETPGLATMFGGAIVFIAVSAHILRESRAVRN
jgi:drug/metabolite transporter (DMT)-like permease